LHKINHHSTARIVRRYRNIAGATVGAVLFLILVGGLVRMTGSGMGCPDWPKCFGQWVPPTDISELPADYKTRFQVAGKEIADFDAFKTWVEYLNRLVGVVIGGLAILTVLFAWPLRKLHPLVWRYSLAGLVLTILQGGLGAIVVKTNLQVGMITLHMFFALIILACFLAAWLYSAEDRRAQEAVRLPDVSSGLVQVSFAALGVLLVQILFGTQVREMIDELAIQLGEAERANWLDSAGFIYSLHSVFYYAVVGIWAYLTYQIRPLWSVSPRLKNLTIGLWATLAVEVLLGLGMHHLGLPAALQPLHLLLATLLFAGNLMLAWTLWIYRKHQKPTLENAQESELESVL
jgi:cytochrome c oxidase assembly protein subunit 15